MTMMQAAPLEISLINDILALRWADGREDYLPAAYLRAHSPSAENVGESDILGRRVGGAPPGQTHEGVTILGWVPRGNYAIAIHFSDGHRSGLYSWEYLRRLGETAS